MTKQLEAHIAELQKVLDGPNGKYWAHGPAFKALIAALEQAQQYAKQRDEESQDLMLTVGRLRVEREHLEASQLAVKLPPRKTAADYVDDVFTNEDLAAIYNVTRLECSVRIKNAGGTVEGE